MEITKAQKKILIVGLSALAAFIIFWVFVYLPAESSVKKLKAKLIDLEGKIFRIEAIIGEENSFEEGFNALEEEFQRLERMLPDSEEDTLRAISDAAHRLGIDIISIKPQPKVPFSEEEDVTIDGRPCEKMAISIIIRSKFKELGEFFEILRKDIDQLLTVERVGIAKVENQTDLNADVKLTIYLLAEGEKRI